MQMKMKQWLLASAVGMKLMSPSFAAQNADTIESLKQQIQELDQKVRILERKDELEKETAEAKAKDTPKITLGEKGFGFASADGNFGVQIKGVLQVDSQIGRAHV
jgi:phosphate-selective porin OprO/OprP